jgi:integrase/recombinase XerD
MERLVYEFLDHLKRRKYSGHTLYEYRRILGDFFRFVGDIYPDVHEITDITRHIVQSYEKYLMTKKDFRGKTLSRNRRKRYLLYTRKFFQFLEQGEKIFTNPAGALALPRDRRTIIRDVLSIEEMEELIKACPGITVKQIRDRAILELLYSSGIRAEELCALETPDIDLSERLLYIRKGKGGVERIVPIGELARIWVEAYLVRSRPSLAGPGSELLFVSLRGRKLQPQALLDLVKHYGRIAGIEKKVTTHTFRHSCATHMLKGGADIRFVQKMLGHKRIATTERYLKIEITDLKEVLERCHPREREEW